MNVEEDEINESLDKLLVDIILTLDKVETIHKNMCECFKYI